MFKFYIIANSLCCNSSPCKNSGICNPLPNAGYTCLCLPGYTGINCEIVVSACSLSCLNGGTCQIIGGVQQCLCLYGFSGAYCQTCNIQCTLSCQNGGVCQFVNGVQTCVCPSGFVGSYCQTCNFSLLKLSFI